MLRHLRILFSYRELLLMWTIRELKIRYKQSFLGIAWAILQPLSLMLVFSFIFVYIIKVQPQGTPYPVFLYCALLPWIFFSSSISTAVPSLVNNINLVTKIYFPREILPITAVSASLIDFLIASIVFAGLLLFYRIPISVTVILTPFVLAVQIVLTLGLVFITSAANVFYRDIRFIIPLSLQLLMYATPVIYPISYVPERFLWLYMINPMAGIIESYRAIILEGAWPEWNYLASACGISLLVFICGYIYFKHVEWQFADLI